MLVLSSLYELNPSINEINYDERKNKKSDVVNQVHIGQGHVKITQHVGLVISVGLSKY